MTIARLCVSNDDQGGIGTMHLTKHSLSAPGLFQPYGLESAKLQELQNASVESSFSWYDDGDGTKKRHASKGFVFNTLLRVKDMDSLCPEKGRKMRNGGAGRGVKSTGDSRTRRVKRTRSKTRTPLTHNELTTANK